MDGAKFFGAAKGGDGKWKRLQFLRKGWLWILGTHVSQVESENKHKRSRHAPEGQRAHSPGQHPGYDEAMKCALKGQKH